MRSFISLLLLLLPLSLCAQVNDMFYVPKKEIKQKDVVKVLSSEEDEWGVADNGNNRDVDEYNRRGKVVSRSSGASSVSGENEAYDTYVTTTDVCDETLLETDYNYSKRIVRFYNPTNIVVAAPWCWDIYPSYWYYDGFWGTHWDFYWHYGYNYSWHTPLLHHSWHHAPLPPHHGHYGGVKNNTARRIPVTSMRAGAESKGRVPVATATGEKRPVANRQVNEEGRRERGNVTGKVANRENRRSSVQGGERREKSVQRNSSSSTYNRRSSTSVNRSSSVARPAGNRAPVSRGGVSRGGRR